MDTVEGITQPSIKKESPKDDLEPDDGARLLRAVNQGVEYNMTHGQRGYALILNFTKFHPRLGQGDRDGSEVDAEKLCDTFGQLGFDVDRRDNLTEKEVWSVLLKYGRQTDHSSRDCFVLCYLSHGEDDRLYTSDSRFRCEDLAFDFMPDACPSLAGKPKLFFIQACRGRKYDRGVHVTDDHVTDDTVDAAPTNIRKIPAQADILWAYSVVPGHYSWRNNVDGSWFIQSLCVALQQHAALESLTDVLLRVCRLVAEQFESDTDQRATTGMKQVPCIVSTLTRKLILAPTSQ